MSAVTTLPADDQYNKMWVPIENASKPRIGKKVMVMHSDGRDKSVLDPHNIFYGIFIGHTAWVSKDGKSIIKRQLWKVPNKSPPITHWLKCEK